jgi:hypothetical protein
MPMMNYVPQTVKDFFGFRIFAPVLSAVSEFAQAVLGYSFGLVRQHNPTLHHIVNAYEKSHDVRHIVKTTVIHNVLYYAAPVVGVKLLFASARNYMPMTSTIFICCEEGVLISLAVYMTVANALYNVALTKAVHPYLPDKDQDTPVCDCKPAQKFYDSLANIVLYLSLQGSLSATAMLLPENAVMVLQAVVYGSTLAGMQYSIRGVCASHYAAVLHQNKTYYLALGATIVYSVKQAAHQVNSLAGVKPNYYIEDVAFNLIWQQAILITVMQTRSPDYLNHFRKTIKTQLEVQFKKLLASENKKISTDYVKRLNRFLVAPLTSTLFAPSPVQLTLNIYQKELNATLTSIAWLKESKGMSVTTWMIDNLPRFLTSDEVKIFSAILKQQNWRETEDFFKCLLKKIDYGRDVDEITRYIEPIANTLALVEETTPTPVEPKTQDRDDDFEQIDTPAANTNGHTVTYTTYRQRR